MSHKEKTILLVEDEEPMLEAMANKFKKEGFKILKAHDGEEGFELAEKHHPHVVVLDIIMPKIDGMTVMKKIRALDRWGKDVPIIMLTNLSDPDSVSEAAQYQVYDFLVKTDWRLDDVAQLVKDKLPPDEED